MKLQVIYEDAYILACHKPAGVATQTAALRQQDMVTLMQNYRRRKGEEPYIGLLQRLDQPVEGIVVAAKDPKTAAELSRQLQAHTITKEYVAIIPENKIPKQDVLEDWLVKDAKTNTSHVAAQKQANAKKAKLTYETVSPEYAAESGIKIPEGFTAVRICLETGRHHQIRVQFASRGCPLLGDEKYGGVKPEGTERMKGIGLCAVRIVLQHPKTKKTLELTTICESYVDAQLSSAYY